MTTIQDGMTSAAFFAALTANFTELATNWSCNVDSFNTYTTPPTGLNMKAYLEHDFRMGGLNIGNAAGLKNFLNTGFASTVQRFQDNLLENIAAPETAYGEPTALVSDDGNQIDIWFAIGSQIYYSYSTNGTTFAVPVATDIPSGYLRNHILKVGSTYYHYASYEDTTIHLFTGTNKINFTDQNEVIGIGAPGSYDAVSVANSFVFKEGSTWYMLYDAQSAVGADWKQCLAIGTNEITFTKYVGNPVLSGVSNSAGNSELARVNNEVIKHNGNYYLYYMDNFTTVVWANLGIYRAYSSDLINWTKEGIILDNQKIHGGGKTYGDQCLVQFKGKSYLFFNPSNQVDTAHIDCVVDNRTLAELLAVKP